VFQKSKKIIAVPLTLIEMLFINRQMNTKFSILLIFILFLSCKPSRSAYPESDTSRYREIHERLFTIDTHTDTPMNFAGDTFDMSKSHDPYLTGSRVDLPRMKKGGLDAVFLAVFIGQGQRTPAGNAKAKEEALNIFGSIDTMLARNTQLATLALNPTDAVKINKTGKRALFIGLENGYPIGNDIHMVEKFYQLGARYITLCHTKNNDLCDSSNDTTNFNGLSTFGEDVVREMNRLGMMIDVSHISDSSFFDVLRITRTPVIASHSSSRSVCDNPRNLSDEMLQALARNGGVAQVCLLSDYVKPHTPFPARDSARAAVRRKFGDYYKLDEETQRRFRAEWREIDKIYPPKLATVADLCDHIDHMIQIAGIDHVGIGSDFDGGGGLADCIDVSQFAMITKELLRRGYNQEQLAKIWGGNFLRVFNEVIAVSGKTDKGLIN
jgi:membrane dipeptidase